MEKYNEYKDSGIEWLGEIPGHWEVGRIKDVFNQISLSSNILKKDTYIPLENLEAFTGRLIKYASNENDETTNLFKRGDVLFNKLRPYLGKVYFANFDGGVSGEVIVYRTKNALKSKYDSKYFFYRFLSSKFIFKVNSLTEGVKMPRTNPFKISSLNIAFPPLKEQTQIANYLDAKTNAIDKKESLLQQKIKHYKAYRKTLINETVTKGLDKTVKLKDSGIDWIGEIPEHWEVKRLKDLSNFINGFAFNSKEYIDSGIPIIRISNISNDINFEECKYVDSSYLKLAKDSLIKVNDILVAMTGATIGKNAIYKEEKKALLNQRVGIIRAKKLINNLFLFQLIKSQIFKDYIDLLCGGSAQENISKTQIENFYIQLPPLNEQQQIADFLGAKTNTIDNIINNIETQITILKELRKTLINEVVTGKVKVTA